MHAHTYIWKYCVQMISHIQCCRWCSSVRYLWSAGSTARVPGRRWNISGKEAILAMARQAMGGGLRVSSGHYRQAVDGRDCTCRIVSSYCQHNQHNTCKL